LQELLISHLHHLYMLIKLFLELHLYLFHKNLCLLEQLQIFDI